MGRRLASVLSPFLVIAGLAAPALADPFQEHYDKAVAAFLAERYPESLAEFQEAYKVRQLPRLLINIGTVHRKLGQASEALAAYQAYLRIEPEPEPAIRAKLDELLAQTRAMLAPGASGPSLPAQAPASRHRARPKRAAPEPRTVFFEPLPPPPGVDVVRALVPAPDGSVLVSAGSRVLRSTGASWDTRYRPWSGDPGWVGKLSDGRFWAAGTRGTVLVLDGGTWHEVAGGDRRTLICGWSDASGAPCFLDTSGSIHRLEGTEWFNLETGWSGTVVLHGCAAFPGGTVLAVGSRGAVLRWDGKAMTGLLSGTTETLLAVWGSGPTDAWLAGARGTVLRYDGTRFRPVPTGREDRTLASIWGDGTGTVWTAGGDFVRDDAGRNRAGGSYEGIGTVLHHDGRRWATAADAVPSPLFAISGEGRGRLLAVGRAGGTVRFDGTSWIRLPPAGGGDLYGLASADEGRFWAVGNGGTVASLRNGKWSLASSRPDRSLDALARAADGSLWAAGYGGLVLRGDPDGRTWEKVETATSADLSSIWASPDGQVFAAGHKGSDGVVLRGRETRFEPPEVVSPWAVTALWGSGPDDVWATAAGGSCQIFRWDGQRWRARSPIEGDLPCDCTLSTIWGSGPRDVWAGGCKGILIRFDGAAWRRIPLGPDWETRTIRAIWGRGPTEVWAAAANGSTGDRPVVLRFDGKTWTPFRSEQPLVRIAGTGEGRIWGVDARGRVGTLDLH